MRIEVNLDGINTHDLDMGELTAGLLEDHEIEVKNTEKYLFKEMKCFLTAGNGLLEIVECPDNLKGYEKGVIKLKSRIPASVDKPLEGRIEILGKYVIK